MNTPPHSALLPLASWCLPLTSHLSPLSSCLSPLGSCLFSLQASVLNLVQLSSAAGWAFSKSMPNVRKTWRRCAPQLVVHNSCQLPAGDCATRTWCARAELLHTTTQMDWNASSRGGAGVISIHIESFLLRLHTLRRTISTLVLL